MKKEGESTRTLGERDKEGGLRRDRKGWIKVGGARPSHFLRFKITTILLLHTSPEGTRPLLLSWSRYKSEGHAPLPSMAQPRCPGYAHQMGVGFFKSYQLLQHFKKHLLHIELKKVSLLLEKIIIIINNSACMPRQARPCGSSPPDLL